MKVRWKRESSWAKTLVIAVTLAFLSGQVLVQARTPSPHQTAAVPTDPAKIQRALQKAVDQGKEIVLTLKDGTSRVGVVMSLDSSKFLLKQGEVDPPLSYEVDQVSRVEKAPKAKKDREYPLVPLVVAGAVVLVIYLFRHCFFLCGGDG